MRSFHTAVAVAAILFGAATARAQGDASLPVHNLDLVLRILAAEDERAVTLEQQTILMQALSHSDAAIQRLAVRAVGRLERPESTGPLIRLLGALPSPVRAEAANALGQSLSGSDPGSPKVIAEVLDALLRSLSSESNFVVRGVICETLGRLRVSGTEQLRRIEHVLVENAARTGSAPGIVSGDFPAGIRGAVKGLEALMRLNQKTLAPEAATVQRLKDLVSTPLPPTLTGPSVTGEVIEQRGVRGPMKVDLQRLDAGRRHAIRALAMQTLITTRAVDAETFKAAGHDADAELLRLRMVALGQSDAFPDAERIIEGLIHVGDGAHRYEAIRAYARRREASACRHLFDALDDGSAHVTLLAIDLIDERCPSEETVDVLTRLADTLSGVVGVQTNPRATPPMPPPNWKSGSRLRSAGSWHRPAHALVSLAKTAPNAARERLATFVDHGVWQVRMYAARAATVLGDSEALEKLGRDDHDNVREAAIEGLVKVKGHKADEIYLDALARPDYQLIRTAAAALEATPEREVATKALLLALDRLTDQRRDTSRDPRIAILTRLREVASPADAASLRPYLEDFDPRVAAIAADILNALTGDPHVGKPRPLPRPPFPTRAELELLDDARAVITMRGGGVITLRLLTGEAPLTVTRFARLARAGYYNGLTFHRVVPNFVLQGGSPGANEYMGDGPYMRDELGLVSNGSGTLGVSTRGRDTGDAQIFINLVDNVRLDHDYTVFARVIGGGFVIDDILEGDVIERVEIESKK